MTTMQGLYLEGMKPDNFVPLTSARFLTTGTAHKIGFMEPCDGMREMEKGSAIPSSFL